MRMIQQFRFFLYFSLLLGFGCGNTEKLPPQPSSECPQNQALIGVSDGSLTALCGCGEKKGSTAQAGQTFTCTAAAPLTVTFLFNAVNLDHQIRFDNPSIPASGVSNGSPNSPAAYSVVLSQAGQYPFTDQGLSGRLIVR